ncbi:MAG TPA: hypothetical protein VHD36_08525 [Pirellulales bacterium]|nr:hypothetical protein [Pirellulales bacterium]
MAVAFEELAGSPRIRVNEQGTSAVRTFRVAWADWQEFVQALIGTFRVLGLATEFVPPIEFPGLPYLIVTDVQVEPFDPENPDGTSAIDLGSFANTYSVAGARVTATYRTMFDEFSPSRRDLPNVPGGTFLTYSADLGSERMTVPGRVWNWAGSSERVADDINPGIHVPHGSFTLRWQRVPNPPWSQIRALRGKVNGSTFLSSPPGTVMFQGARASRRFQFVEDGGFWNLDYMFAENTKTLSDGVTDVGWNHFYKEAALGGEHWVAIENQDGNPPLRLGRLSATLHVRVIHVGPDSPGPPWRPHLGCQVQRSC